MTTAKRLVEREYTTNVCSHSTILEYPIMRAPILMVIGAGHSPGAA